MLYLNYLSVYSSLMIKGLLVFSLLVFALPPEAIFAQNNPKISIQGTLKNANGNTVSDGTYELTFKLYQQATGGTAVWEEIGNVDVVGGVYSYMLGTNVALDPNVFSNAVWLGIVIEGFELSPRTEFSYSPYSFAVEFAQKVACSGAVGDVKHSILNPTQFAAVNGDCWVPMDGRALDPSDELRQITGMTNVPQGGGMFLRAQDFSNSDNDPNRDHNSTIASVQDDAFASHQHGAGFLTGSTNLAGSHRHFTGVLTNHPNDEIAYGNEGFDGTDGTATRRVADSAGTSNPKRSVTNFDGAHEHTVVVNSGETALSGGDETRPKNLNFWIYIRIN
ncbi:MAG: hypothetical protein EA409_12175 [Saprospirales bacterium]|nr:MAG: hypothetical protein EA409_12175 [Saprospirales bacterium]